MLDWTTCLAVERDPEKLSGAWVFRGTRVPVSALFENLEGGATLDQFLEWFPGVARAQAARRIGQKRIVAPPAVEADAPLPQVEDLAVAMGRRCRTHSRLVMPAR